MEHIRWKRVLVVLMSVFLSATQVNAGDWITKGGNSLRTSAIADLVGQMEATELWRAEDLGPSATQPVVLGSTVYHLAGDYLWRLELAENGQWDGVAERLTDTHNPVYPMPVNQAPTGTHTISQSTPTYSHQSEVLYFGTAYGWVWAYHTRERWFKPFEIALGCPIVGSPLVVHDGQTEFVVVADRPNYEGEKANPEPGQPLCSRSHGKVWIVQGLDRFDGMAKKTTYDAPADKSDEDGFGGFITPSAVPGPIHEEGPTFLIGADGFAGGRAIRLVLNRDREYKPERVWTVDSSSSGFAGNFTSDGTHAYWLDTKGWLWGVNLTNKQSPLGWPGYAINIPALIGGGAAFTNTEPAVVSQWNNQAGRYETHLYLTLRNYAPPGKESTLRSGPTGTDGAVVAIGPGGGLKWWARFPTESGPKTSINTAPLAIISQEALLFGDVTGFLHSYSLETPNQAGGDPQRLFIPKGEREPAMNVSLLNENEQAAIGQFNFSQVSGVGVDPAMANRLVLVGVNYTAEGEDAMNGRLVAYRLGEGYDLRWADPAPAEPVAIPAGQPYRVSGRVELDLTDKRLDQLCDGPLAVQWYLTDSSGQLVRRLADSILPTDLKPKTPVPVALDLTLAAGDPEDGRIVGVIDHPSVHVLSGDHPSSDQLQAIRPLAGALGEPKMKSCTGPASEVIRRPDSSLPEGGLVNNIRTVAYQRRQVVDDPFVADLNVPAVSVTDAFDVRIRLGYRNSEGAQSVEPRVRLYVRPGPSSAPPPGGWEVRSIPLGCCKEIVGSFADVPEGTWEVVVEIDYPPDTHPANNQMVRTLLVKKSAQNEAPGTGSGLSD